MKFWKTIGLAALAGASQVVISRGANQASAPITGGNVAVAAGVSALLAVLGHLMHSPLDPSKTS
jgi:hypothetical protein